MKRISLLFLSLLMVFALAACGSEANPAEKLGGSWTIDVAATIDNNPALKNSIPEGEAGTMARGMIETMLSSMSLTFDMKANTVSGSMGSETLEDKKFEVGTVNGDAIDLKIDGDTATFTVTGDAMTLKAPDGTTLYFTRKK